MIKRQLQHEWIERVIAHHHDAVMERVDAQGHVVGFSLMGVSQFRKEKPLEADLVLFRLRLKAGR